MSTQGNDTRLAILEAGKQEFYSMVMKALP